MPQVRYWNKKMETMPRKELLKFQLRKIKAHVKYAVDNTSYYKRKFRELGITPEDIRTIDDFKRKISPIVKDEVRTSRDSSGDPFGGFLAVPRAELKWIHCSTGTTGLPTYQAMTAEDGDAAAESLARWHYAVGLRKGDLVLSLLFYYHQYSQWMDSAYQKVGVSLFRRGGFPFEVEGDLKQIKLWTYLNPQSIAITYHPFRIVTHHMKKSGIDPKRAFPKLKAIQIAGDIITRSARREWQDFWGVPIYEAGGPTDVLACTIGVCSEAVEGWTHVWEDQWVMEVIDPETSEQVSPGERGELVYTNLNLRGTPYLRWKSEDMVEWRGYDCECGRTHISVKLLGRVGHTVRINDRRICMRDVDEVLQEFENIRYSPYQLVREPSQPQEHLVIRLARDATKNGEAIKAALEEKLGTKTRIETISPEEIRMLSGWKLARFAERKKT